MVEIYTRKTLSILQLRISDPICSWAHGLSDLLSKPSLQLGVAGGLWANKTTLVVLDGRWMPCVLWWIWTWAPFAFSSSFLPSSCCLECTCCHLGSGVKATHGSASGWKTLGPLALWSIFPGCLHKRKKLKSCLSYCHFGGGCGGGAFCPLQLNLILTNIYYLNS